MTMLWPNRDGSRVRWQRQGVRRMGRRGWAQGHSLPVAGRAAVEIAALTGCGGAREPHGKRPFAAPGWLILPAVCGVGPTAP